MGESERLARAVFALLVLATFAAFFVTQRLKHSPTVVQSVTMQPFFSPNGRGHRLEKMTFLIKRADDVTVTVVNPSGDDIATLARDQRVPAYKRLKLSWDGRTDSGERAPDATYRVRVRLRNEGRSLILSRSFRLHATPPRPLITQIGSGGAPVIMPQPRGAPVTISFSLGGGAKPKLMIYRTDVSPARLVRRLAVAAGATSATWDGTAARGRRVGPGTYLVAIRATDVEGNTGSTPAQLPPAPQSGEVVPGHAGITVRYLGVEPPAVATDSGRPVFFGVDARRAAYDWTLTRLGAGRPRKRGHATRPLLRLAAPGGVSGVYLLGVRSGRRSSQVPFAVQGPGLQRVLVVLPAITWLGQDPVDDDGDGLPNTLDGGVPVGVQRVFAGSGMPNGFAERTAPALTFLDHNHLRYDITTDLALAQHSGVVVRGHTGIMLAGDERWLPPNVEAQLRGFVRRGGKLASLGVDSLRRGVALADSRLSSATAPSSTDLFGAHPAPLAKATGPITNFLDQIGLFSGGAGQFSGYHSYEATQSVGAASQLVASAVTGEGRAVVTAVRYGRGLVIRTGLPELPGRLTSDAAASALLRQIWTLLSQ
jgi:flagellar hook assembly protein FlgD